MIHSHIAGDVSVQDDMQKGSFQRMVLGDWVSFYVFLLQPFG